MPQLKKSEVSKKYKQYAINPPNENSLSFINRFTKYFENEKFLERAIDKYVDDLDKKEGLNAIVQGRWDTAYRYLEQYYNTRIKEHDAGTETNKLKIKTSAPTSKSKNKESKNKESKNKESKKENKHVLLPRVPSTSGDTIKLGSNRFAIPYILNLDDVVVSHVNRPKNITRSNAPEQVNNTFGSILHAHGSFEPVTIQRDSVTHDFINADGNPAYKIGYDQKGHIKVGPATNFTKGDTWAHMYGVNAKIKGFKKNKDGSLYLDHADGGPHSGNGGWAYAPFVELSDGSILQLGIYSSKKAYPRANRYGGGNGGSLLVQFTPSDGTIRQHIIAGSLEQLSDSFDALKKAYGVDEGYIYQLDNGSFSDGIHSTTGNISKDDNYYSFTRNSHNGHYLYPVNRTIIQQ